LDDFRFGDFRFGDFRLDDFRLDDFRLGDFRLGDFRFGDFRFGDFRLGDFRLAPMIFFPVTPDLFTQRPVLGLHILDDGHDLPVHLFIYLYNIKYYLINGFIKQYCLFIFTVNFWIFTDIFL